MEIKRGQRKTRREKKRQRKYGVVLVVSLLVIVASFIYCMNHRMLAVSYTIISGEKTLYEPDLMRVIDAYKGEYWLGIIPKDNMFILNTDTIKARLEEQFPKIETIDIEIQGRDTLVVEITERLAHSLWCVYRETESVFDQECYFANTTGLLYARAPYFSGNVYMKVLFAPQDDAPIIGTTINAISSFDLFFAFLDELEEEQDLDVSHIAFGVAGDIEIVLRRLGAVVYTTRRPSIFINSSDDYETILENIDITLGYDTFKQDFSSRGHALESIDVRFDERVFYTFRTP